MNPIRLEWKWSRKQFKHSILICMKFVFDCIFRHESSRYDYVTFHIQFQFIILRRWDESEKKWINFSTVVQVEWFTFSKINFSYCVPVYLMCTHRFYKKKFKTNTLTKQSKFRWGNVFFRFFSLKMIFFCYESAVFFPFFYLSCQV